VKRGGAVGQSVVLLRRADGSEVQVSPCQYEHLSPSGNPSSGALGPSTAAVAPNTEPAVEPAIGHSWIENSSATSATSYGKEVSTWKVPPVPLMQDGQTIYFFPGFEDIDATQSILQPVIGSYDGGQWSMTSWNCCLSGITVVSTAVAINVGDTILGTSEMTCAAGTTTCATWNVIAEDQTINQSTELTATPSDGQTFNWVFGGVMEIYNVDQCLDYPPDAMLTMTSKVYDNNFNLISSPDWGYGNPSSTLAPQCNYGVSATGTDTTLKYGFTGPGFGLDVSPAVGIAVNQGSSATGDVTVTDINGFTGATVVSESGAPSGVTARLGQGITVDGHLLKLTATGDAVLTGKNAPSVMTVTAKGTGATTETFAVGVIVNPPLTGGVGSVVNLSSYYNAYAFFDDADGWPALNATDSLDGDGDAYSANQLNPPGLSPMALDFNGVQYNFGTPNQTNGVYGTGSNPITLPSVKSDTLEILGTGANGAQASQSIMVTYSDNSTKTFTQTFDDWSTGPVCTPANVCTAGESVAVAMPYNDTQYVYPRNDSMYYLYGYSFALDSSKTLKSVTLPDNSNVVVLAVTLVNDTATPTISPAGGTITSPESVTIADATAGATIYYTTDGSTPTTASAVYTSAITVSSTETVEAIAVASGDAVSGVATESYTLATPAATPVFTPAGGTYSSAQSVTVTDSTAGATIYYTTDGSTPTTSSSVYKSAIAVSTSETLNAIASASNSSLSAVATAVYTIPPGFAISGTAVSVAPGATSGNTSTISLTPVGGFTGAISLSCAITPAAASDPATCSLPASVSISGSAAQTVVLTVTTTPATSALSRPAKFGWGAVDGTALACMLLVVIPARRRKGWRLIGVLLLSLFVAGGAVGCTGSPSSGGGNPGTSAGTYVVTVTGTAGSVTETGTVSLTVQ